MKIIIVCLFLSTLSSLLSAQETRYILDELYVPLRSGQGTKFRIVHKGLPSGTKVTVLEESGDGKYSRVTTARGTEGWLQSQYLSNIPAGRDLYRQAQVTINQLEKKNNTLQLQLNKLTTDNLQLQQQLKSTTVSNENVNRELAEIRSISSNVIQINTDNQELLEENQALKNQVDVLSTKTKRLEDDESNEAFLNGALSVIIGVMITLIVPRLWPKKKENW